MNKKTLLLILAAAILICSGMLISSVLITPKATDPEPDNNELGKFTYTDVEISTDEYIPDIYDNVETESNFVTFTNAELIYDLLTLEALSHICEDTADFLNKHGYSQIHNLTIDESTIVNDRAYPLFYCHMEDQKDKVLEIRYNIESEIFEYQIVEKQN